MAPKLTVVFYFLLLIQGGDNCCYWQLLTFKSINSVMDLGVTKQLDFEDLIQLPNEMNPSSCHDTLLRCWVAEQSKHCTQPSLFRAICHAYGWPYMCLGLLKVFQFCEEESSFMGGNFYTNMKKDYFIGMNQ